MSLDATRWAWIQDVRPTHKLVLLSLADRAGENNECHPSIARLEKDTGLYRETIMEAVAQLETLGLLKVSRRQGAGNRYRLLGVDMRENQSGKADQYGKADQSAKADRTSREKPTTTSREKPTQNLPIESTKNLPSNTRVADMLISDFPELPESIATDFIAHRKGKRAPLTPTAWKQIANEIRASGWSAADALAEAMAAGWQGVKAEWLAKRSNPSRPVQKLTVVGQKSANAASRWLEGEGFQQEKTA